MPRASITDKLSRVRRPRVQITYDLEKGDAIEAKELPFVVGVMADLSGNPEQALPAMAGRKFVEIDRDTFDNVLAGAKPRLVFKVPNAIGKNKDDQIGVKLEFNSLDDFSPESVARQVGPIRKLVEERARLHELSVQLASNEKLEELLQTVVKNTEQLQSMKALGDASPAASEPEEGK